MGHLARDNLVEAARHGGRDRAGLRCAITVHDSTETSASESPTTMGAEDFVMPPSQSPWASLDSILPLLLFVVINARFFVLPDTVGSTRLWFALAVAASVGWSLRIVVSRRRRNLPTGRFIPIVTAWLVIKGLGGILTGNEDIFFAMSIGAKIAIGVALLVSVAVGKSAAAMFAPVVFGFSERVQRHNSYVSAMAAITVVGALYEFASAAFDVWLLFVRDASANEFVIVRYIANWGASTVVMIGAMLWVGHKLSEIDGFPGLMAVFEAHVEAQAERLGWDLSAPATD